jgi:hypothetical protein
MNQHIGINQIARLHVGAGVAVQPRTHASLTDYVLNFTKPFLAFRLKIFGTGTFIDR